MQGLFVLFYIFKVKGLYRKVTHQSLTMRGTSRYGPSYFPAKQRYLLLTAAVLHGGAAVGFLEQAVEMLHVFIADLCRNRLHGLGGFL